MHVARLHVVKEEIFRYFKAENAVQIPGYGYIGSTALWHHQRGQNQCDKTEV